MRKWFVLSLVGLSILGVNNRAGAQHSETQHAQAQLPTEKLTITTEDKKQHEFVVEVASTPEQQQQGEMFRNSVPEMRGMLFVWPMPQESLMWMKNTLVPLDMIFIGPDKTIHAIEENTVPQSLAQISSHGLVIAALELKGGESKRLGLKVGDKVSSPSLKSTP